MNTTEMFCSDFSPYSIPHIIRGIWFLYKTYEESDSGGWWCHPLYASYHPSPSSAVHIEKSISMHLHVAIKEG